MIQYTINGENKILDYDQYYICHEYDASEDYLGMSLPADHPQSGDMIPRLQLTDTETGNVYRIHAIDQGAKSVGIKARIDLQALQSEMVTSWDSGSLTPAAAFGQIAPAGWTIIDRSGITTRRSEVFRMMTRLEIMKKLLKKWPGLTWRINNSTKEITLRYPANESTTLAFFSDEVNMVKRPQKKTKSAQFITKLYAEGKDGLNFASINGGKKFVTCNDFSDEIICGYWKDERYTDAQSLLEDAQAKVREMATPAESYELAVVDLAKLKPADFSYMAVDVLDKVTVMDRKAKKNTTHHIARYLHYPFYPALNVITLSTTPGTISKTQAITVDALQSYTSDFNEQQRAVINTISKQMSATDVMDATVIFHTNSSGKIYEIIICDTGDLSTAREVWLWNSAGLAHSSTGYNGQYTTAITADGKIVADFILAGTLRAIDIDGVNITGATIQGSTLKFGGDGTYGTLKGTSYTQAGTTYKASMLTGDAFVAMVEGKARLGAGTGASTGASTPAASIDVDGQAKTVTVKAGLIMQLGSKIDGTFDTGMINAYGRDNVYIESGSRIQLVAPNGVFVNGERIGR